MNAAGLDLRPLTVSVVGVPAPQGSKRHVGRGRMVESSAGVRPWRDAVAWQARSAMRAQHHPGITTGPVALTVLYRMPRPKYLERRRAVAWPWHKPDLDKLLRSTLDALTDAGALGDDGQVVTIAAGKRYATPGEASGAEILLVSGPRAGQVAG